MSAPRWPLLLALGVTVAGAAAAWLNRAELAPEPTVVFVVLDTVRADRLSVCGYDKPTTPVLEQLVARGATITCDAYAPGAWTLPSHASFFTGLPVWEHGAVMATGGEGQALFDHAVHPLSEDLPTLAERMAERGYATVLLSENSVVGPKTGLDRGYELVQSWYRCGQPSPGYLHPELDRLLGELAEDPRPLFLTVNICQAHAPRSGAPEGIEWLDHHAPARVGDRMARRFLHGEMTPEQQAAWLAELSDAYDWSVFLADQALGRVLQQLVASGRADGGIRLVVTSDHGEMLGEHGVVEHMEFLWEPTARIPLVMLSESEPVALPEQVSGLVVHDLVLNGLLPEPLPDITAVSAPVHSRRRPPWPDDRPPTPMAAHWSQSSKRMIIDGSDHQIDLVADPDELVLNPAATDASQARLRERYDVVQEQSSQAGDPGTHGLLQELGYVE